MDNYSVIFDLDGTLIDSAPDVCRALNRTLGRIGRRPHDVAEIITYLGHGAPVLMERALAHTGGVPDKQQVESLTALFLDDYAKNPVVDSRVYPGVPDALDQLKSAGAILAICTNKPSITAAPVLEALGLDTHFEAILCGDQVRMRKPDKAHILETIGAAGGSQDRAVMVGDSENDIYAAIDAGVPSIALTHGYTHIPYPELGATMLIDHFEELPDAVRAIADHGNGRGRTGVSRTDP